MEVTMKLAERDFRGLCFVNLVEFDSHYGHRNNAVGYAEALNRFDEQLGQLLPLLKEEDVLIITADHGCDPSTPSTDHSREYTPLLICGRGIRENIPLGTGESFGNIAATIADLFALGGFEEFESYCGKIVK